MESATWEYDALATGKRISKILSERGSATLLVSQVRLKKSAPSRWKIGTGLSPEVLGRIAIFGNCSVDFIIGLGSQQEEAKQMAQLDDPRMRKRYQLIFEMKALIGKLDDEVIDLFINQVEFWKKRMEENQV